jgi:hypothetical protein
VRADEYQHFVTGPPAARRARLRPPGGHRRGQARVGRRAAGLARGARGAGQRLPGAAGAHRTRTAHSEAPIARGAGYEVDCLSLRPTSTR